MAVIVVGIGLIVNFAAIPVYPVWSLVVITMEFSALGADRSRKRSKASVQSAALPPPRCRPLPVEQRRRVATMRIGINGSGRMLIDGVAGVSKMTRADRQVRQLLVQVGLVDA